MSEIKFEIIETLGVISEGSKGWQKELNLISWNGRKAKLDVRDWSSDHQRMGKGITLTREEMRKLMEIVAASNLDVHDID